MAIVLVHVENFVRERMFVLTSSDLKIERDETSVDVCEQNDRVRSML